MKRLYKLPLIPIALAVLAISLLLFVPKDPDFFWHLKYGELTLEQGPISDDPFSHTFSDYQFYDYQWGSHVLMYGAYALGGYFLVAIIYGLMVAAALWLTIQSIGKKLPNSIKLAAFLYGAITMAPLLGIRPQVVSILGVALVYVFSKKYLENRSRLLYLTPLVMLVWANMHPGFIAGLLILGLLFASQIIKIIAAFLSSVFENTYLKERFKALPRRDIATILIVTLASTLATIITPFAFNILKQSIEFSLDPYSQNAIMEWLAPNFHTISGKLSIAFLIVVIITSVKQKSFSFFQVLILSVFGYMSVNTIRHLPLFVIVSLPIILSSLWLQKLPKIDTDSLLLFTIKVFALLASLFVLFFSATTFIYVNNSDEHIYQYTNYPIDAINYIRDNKLEGPLFNLYRWGGFLAWEYPEEKVFIDGRMTSWVIDDNRILKVYRDTYRVTDVNWQQTLSDYNINLVLVDIEAPIGNALRHTDSWEVVYEDEIAVVIIRKD